MNEDSVLTLAGLRDSHAGRRCFVIGNGPSLNQTDLTCLRDEITIGMNRIYMKFDEIGFATTYLCCDNALVLKQFGAELHRVPSTLFVSGRAGYEFRGRSKFHLMDSLPGAGFNFDLSNGAWYSGATVTYCSLQLAYYLGCKDVILLGVDHNFVTKGTAHKTVTSSGEDPNHFDGSYFGKGIKWQLPDLVESEASYSLARAVFEASGRRIRDATVGGKLAIFDKAVMVAGQSSPEVHDIKCVADPQEEGRQVSGDPPSRMKVFEILNSESFGKVRLVGVPLLAIGLALMLWTLGPLKGFQILTSAALIVGGVLAIVASYVVPVLIQDARRRRLKDSRLLRNSIETIVVSQQSHEIE